MNALRQKKQKDVLYYVLFEFVYLQEELRCMSAADSIPVFVNGDIVGNGSNLICARQLFLHLGIYSHDGIKIGIIMGKVGFSFFLRSIYIHQNDFDALILAERLFVKSDNMRHYPAAGAAPAGRVQIDEVLGIPVERCRSDRW